MPKRKCLFNDDLQIKFPMLKKGKNYWEAFCIICTTNISIANKGLTDINEHLTTQKHKTNLKNQAGSSNIATYFVKSSSEDLRIRAAEGALVYPTVSHHMSFNSLDCTCSLNREIFSGSDTANKITCNRTKATAIATGVLSPLSVAELRNDLQDVQFISMQATDASNHGSTKLFPLIILYFDVKRNGISTKLLEIGSTQNETSDTITDLIIKQLRLHDLLSKCIAFGGDNCTTNFGGIERQGLNNVFHELQQNLNPNIVGVGCSAHVINNAVHHGCDLLPVDAEAIILKIYNFFATYTVRTLKEFCENADVEYKQLLYHSKTRWLSLFPAIERLLKLYLPLKDYFDSVERPPVLIKLFFNNSLSEAYIFLIQSIMHISHSKIEKLEKSDNSVIETSQQDKLLNANQLWLQFFRTPNAHLYSELLKIAQYFLCIPAHNANVERIFSLIAQQWTKERNLFKTETVSSVIKIKYNFKECNCIDFYKFLLGIEDILKAIEKADKYQKFEK